MHTRAVSAVAVVLAVVMYVGFLLAGSASPVTVSTNDGMTLTLNSDGSWNSLTVDGNTVPQLSGVTGGFVVAAMDGVTIPYQRNTFYPGTAVTGTATQNGGNVNFTGTANNLTFSITLTGGQPYIKVDGTVTGPGTDRCFMVYFRVPVDATNWTWWDDVNTKRTIAAGSGNWYFANYHFHQARHPDLSLNPFGAVTKTTSPTMGLSLSPFFYPPSAYAIQYNSQGGFWIEFELATTSLTTKHPNTADFHFVLYKHDPFWGDRSAVKKFQDAFPAWFARAYPGGNWYLDPGTSGRPTTPSDFALKYQEGYNWSDSWTDANNIYTCKYQEPWCWHLQWTTVAQLEAAAEDTPANALPYCPAKGQSIAESAQQAILSGNKNPDGTYIGPDDRTRWSDGRWNCDGSITTYRYITNPDVEIPNFRNFTLSGLPGRNRGQSVEYWEWYQQWGEAPGPTDHYTGLYHDSVGGGWAGWGAVHNLAAEHWGTYDYNAAIFEDYDWSANIGKPCMWAAFSNIEFAKAAYEQMTLEDRVVIANSSPTYELFMVAPFLDMIGAGESYASSVHNESIIRMIAGKKPCSFLGGAQTESAIKDCLTWGIYPGFDTCANYESYRTLYKKYMPILGGLDAAGWEPITAATANVAAMVVERFGPDAGGALYLTVRNTGGASATTITVRNSDLGWPSNPNKVVTELISGNSVSTSYDGSGNLTFTTDSIAQNDTRCYKVATPGAEPPVANFTGNPTSGAAPLNVAFTDTSTGSPTSWSWTFGDGGTSTAQNPSHQYAAGTFTVSLTATNAYGSDGETKTNYITATGAAQDYFCASCTVNTGTLKSGDHTSVHASDNVYLVVGSAKAAGKQTAQVSYTYNTGLGSLSSLVVTVEGKVSTGSQPVTIYAYNYSTSTWTSVGTGTFTTTDSTLTPTVSSPVSYLSGGTVQVRVKVGGSGSTAFDNSTDLVKITAAP